jgi:hypothetical protein
MLCFASTSLSRSHDAAVFSWERHADTGLQLPPRRSLDLLSLSSATASPKVGLIFHICSQKYANRDLQLLPLLPLPPPALLLLPPIPVPRLAPTLPAVLPPSLVSLVSSLCYEMCL